jgi:hypothetical protein
MSQALHLDASKIVLHRNMDQALLYFCNTYPLGCSRLIRHEMLSHVQLAGSPWGRNLELTQVHACWHQDAEARNRIRTMLCAFFPQQDCLPLPPFAQNRAHATSATDTWLSNDLLDASYVSQLRALRQRVLGAPRIKEMHVSCTHAALSIFRVVADCLLTRRT